MACKSCWRCCWGCMLHKLLIPFRNHCMRDPKYLYHVLRYLQVHISALAGIGSWASHIYFAQSCRCWVCQTAAGFRSTSLWFPRNPRESQKGHFLYPLVIKPYQTDCSNTKQFSARKKWYETHLMEVPWFSKSKRPSTAQCRNQIILGS